MFDLQPTIRESNSSCMLTPCGVAVDILAAIAVCC